MPYLRMADVSKRFGGVQALQGASLEVGEGEVHGLLGPNGSGKSTLNKVLSGTVSPDHAEIFIAGEAVTINRPMDAHKHHVASVYQQLSLVPELSVQDNLLLGTEISRGGFVDKKRSKQYAEEALAPFLSGLDAGVTLATEVSELSPGSQQLVEVAKAMARRPKILILDEATASLRRDQVDLVFEQVRKLTAEGVSVVFVSHRLEEVQEICHRATILRNGRTVADVDMEDMSEGRLVRLMVGELVEDGLVEASDQARSNATEEIQVQVTDLHTKKLQGTTMQARKGEVVGLGGLQGQGQSELLHALFGDEPATSGTITLAGVEQTFRSPRDAITAGMALVPGDRGSQGLFMVRPILENFSVVSGKKRLIAHWLISMRKEKAAVEREVGRLQVKIGDLSDSVSTLSGGNQQKIVLGKWLMNDPKVVLLDDPTKGVDVGAKAEIYEIIRGLTKSGITVILNSSDDRELVALCDRVFVLYEGKVAATLTGDEVTEDNLVSAALLVGVEEEAK